MASLTQQSGGDANVLDLVSIAAEIRKEHAAACCAAESALEHARTAGEWLAKAKAAVSHGAWLPWLEEHCQDLSPRTAQAYMRIAASWQELQAARNTQRASHLSIRDALTALATPRLCLPPVLNPALLPDDHDMTFEELETIGASLDAIRAEYEACWAEFKAQPRPQNLTEAAERLRETDEFLSQITLLTSHDLHHFRLLTACAAKALDLGPNLVKQAMHLYPLTGARECDAFFDACRARREEIISALPPDDQAYVRAQLAEAQP